MGKKSKSEKKGKDNLAKKQKAKIEKKRKEQRKRKKKADNKKKKSKKLNVKAGGKTAKTSKQVKLSKKKDKNKGKSKSTLPKAKKNPGTNAASSALLAKIYELLEFRHIPGMIEKCGVPDPTRFTEQLVQLQVSIYYLDHYLETQWEIDQQELNNRWSSIHEALAVFGIPENGRTEMLKQIVRYQSHELDLRDGKSPSRLRLRHYYYYKSCDVRLLRKLVYRAGTTPSKDKLSDWTDFDLITEVHDDIEDLGEDQTLLNGNRLLFGLHEKGKRHTDREFRGFIRTIEGSVRSRFKGKMDPETEHVKQLTLSAIRSARELLRATLPPINREELSSAKIFQVFAK